MKKANQQDGVYLVEALIAMLLMSIIVMGMAFVSSKFLHAKAKANIHNEVVDKLRNILISSHICEEIEAGDTGHSSITIGHNNLEVPYIINNCGQTLETIINGKVVTVPKPIMLVTNSSQFESIHVGINQHRQ